MRKPGYYWVNNAGVWVPAQWDAEAGLWGLCSDNEWYYDEEFEDIGEPCTRQKS